MSERSQEKGTDMEHRPELKTAQNICIVYLCTAHLLYDVQVLTVSVSCTPSRWNTYVVCVGNTCDRFRITWTVSQFNAHDAHWNIDLVHCLHVQISIHSHEPAQLDTYMYWHIHSMYVHTCGIGTCMVFHQCWLFLLERWYSPTSGVWSHRRDGQRWTTHYTEPEQDRHSVQGKEDFT